MEINIYNKNAELSGKKELPAQFSELVRPYLIKRAVLAILANKRQPYGAFPESGLRASIELSHRRKSYKGVYGHGGTRVPRKVMSKRGSQLHLVAATVANVVGGRAAHPPKAEKIFDQKLNDKERKKAIRSALAATLHPELVGLRSHIVPKNYPFIFAKDVESISSTKDLVALLDKLGFNDELLRISKKSVRAGRGKRRSNTYKTVRGMLIVTEKNCSLFNAAKNIPGIDVRSVSVLNANDLAPGCHPGRLTLFTEGAIEALKSKKLFL